MIDTFFVCLVLNQTPDLGKVTIKRDLEDDIQILLSSKVNTEDCATTIKGIQGESISLSFKGPESEFEMTELLVGPPCWLLNIFPFGIEVKKVFCFEKPHFEPDALQPIPQNSSSHSVHLSPKLLGNFLNR